MERGDESGCKVQSTVGGMGMMVRYPVDAILEEAGPDVLDEPMVTYHFDTESKTITTDKETDDSDSESDSDSGDESLARSKPNSNLIDRFQFMIIKASVMKPMVIESIYLHLLVSQLDTCLVIALPDEDGNVFNENANRTLYNIDHPIFNQARMHMDPLIEQAIRLCKDMIRLTRHYGFNTSFVGQEGENGVKRLTVFTTLKVRAINKVKRIDPDEDYIPNPFALKKVDPPKKLDYYQHGELSKEVLRMIQNAQRE